MTVEAWSKWRFPLGKSCGIKKNDLYSNSQWKNVYIYIYNFSQYSQPKNFFWTFCFFFCFMRWTVLLYYAGLHFACLESHFHPRFYYWFIIFSWVLIFLENLFFSSSGAFIWCGSLKTKLWGFWIWLKKKQILPFLFLLHFIFFIFCYTLSPLYIPQRGLKFET